MTMAVMLEWVVNMIMLIIWVIQWTHLTTGQLINQKTKTSSLTRRLKKKRRKRQKRKGRRKRLIEKSKVSLVAPKSPVLSKVSQD